MVNQLDKPIEYGKQDGSSILRVDRQGAEAMIEVEDDGPGIIVAKHEVQGLRQLKTILESYVAYTNFDGGKMMEAVIYPVDLAQTSPPGP